MTDTQVLEWLEQHSYSIIRFHKREYDKMVPTFRVSWDTGNEVRGSEGYTIREAVEKCQPQKL